MSIRYICESGKPETFICSVDGRILTLSDEERLKIGLLASIGDVTNTKLAILEVAE